MPWRWATCLSLAGLFVLMLAPGAVRAQSPDQSAAFPGERERLEERLREYARAEERARQALTRGHDALRLAEQRSDLRAAPVARAAIANAENALVRIRLARERDHARLDALLRTQETLSGLPLDSRGSAGFIALKEGEVHRSGGVPLEAPLRPGDEIATGEPGRVEITLSGGQRVALGPRTTLRVVAEAPDLLEVGRGMLHSFVRCLTGPSMPRGCRAHRVRYAGIAIAVRGTEYELVAAPDGGRLSVFDGTVEAWEPGAEQPRSIKTGEQVVIQPDGTVRDPAPFDPKGHHRWWYPE